MTDSSSTGPNSEGVAAALLDRLSRAAPALEESGAWPQQQLDWLADADVLRWNVPDEFGGDERDPSAMTAAYEQLAAACLTTTFVLSQRNAACLRLVNSENDSLRRALLPDLAHGKTFATVGISHLTTSRQHLAQPAVRAEFQDDELLLSGTVPWVTGAAAADYIVTGGTCDDGRQMLIALPQGAAGVSIADPPRMLALNASHTASVRLDNVRVSREFVVAGPVEGVIGRVSAGGTGSFTTSALAVGLSRRAILELEREVSRRPDLSDVVTPLRSEFDGLRSDMYAAIRGEASSTGSNVTAAALRQRANSLVLRVTQAQLAASKGAGFVAGHPAERAVREAMFFLVWSCPQPVVAAAMREFACLTE